MSSSTSAPLPKTIPPGAVVQLYDIIFHIVSVQFVCTIGLIVNIFILIVIRKNKNLQTPCFILICGECVCALFVASGLLVDTVQESLILTNKINSNSTRPICFLTSSLLPALGVQASSLVTASIALDRLFSIARPMEYRNVGKRYPFVMLSICFTYATVATIGGIFSVPSEINSIVECTYYFSAFSRTYMGYYGGFNLTFCGLCVALYTAMLITFEWRKRQIDPNNRADTSFMKQQRACMPTVKLMMAVYAVTAIGPEISVAVASSSEYTAAFMPRMYYYICMVKGAMSWAEILALGLGSKQFRNGARLVLGMEGGQGQPTSAWRQSTNLGGGRVAI